MNNDLIFKPFRDIPIDNNPATNPELVGVLSNVRQFKRQLSRPLGGGWWTTLISFIATTLVVALVLMAIVGTTIALPFVGVVIVFGGISLWLAMLLGVPLGIVSALIHRAMQWCKRKKIEEVPKEVSGSIDNLACFMAATVFRVYFEKDPQQIKRRFNEWGYADQWAAAALCILQRKDINIRDLIAKCTSKKDLEDALKQCGLPCDVINVDTMSRLIDRK